MESSTELATKMKDTTRGVVRWSLQMAVSLVVCGAILFLSAGRLDWLNGWAWFVMNGITQALSAAVLIRRQSEMIADRSELPQGTKSWDRLLAPAVALIGSIGLMVVAGLDVRFGAPSILNGAGWAIAVALAFGSQMFVLWAMASNAFFATTVRIQAERGHSVTEQEPYKLVRHPGYAGSVLYTVLSPLVLGSLWAFLPAALAVVLLVIRTRLEDRTLLGELPGYREYAAAVRYRLVPGVW